MGTGGTRVDPAAWTAVVARMGLGLVVIGLVVLPLVLGPTEALASRASRTAAVLRSAEGRALDSDIDVEKGILEPAQEGRRSRARRRGPSATEPPLVSPADLPARVKALRDEGRYREAAALIEKNIKGMKRSRARAALQVTEAGFLAWAREYDEAIGIYEDVLSEYPEMSSARKGLARVLSWQGRYAEAIREYGKVLEEHPRDTEARLGLASIFAWKGEYRTALSTYRAILSDDPSNTEARLGLGRVLWWMGDREGAVRELDAVLEKDPSNEDAADIERKIHIDTGPFLSLDFVVSDDSDSNHLEIYSAGLYYSPRSNFRLNLVFSEFEASRLDDRSRAKSLGLSLSYRFLEKNTITVRSSLLSLDTPINPTSRFTGGIALGRELSGGFRGGLGYSRYVLLDTAQLIRNDIAIDEFYAYLTGRALSLDFTTGLRYGDYSDDNKRRDFFLDLSRGRELCGVLFTLGYRLDLRDFEKDLNSGYFDPADFMAHTFYGRARGGFYGGRLEYDALAAGGFQSFNSTTESTVKLSLEVKGHVTGRLTIRGGAKYARSALASATGFEYEEYRAGLDYLF